ncbi:Integrin alpha-8 light chain [Listeria monocytogenes N53-1]|nr:Integrin alpha-8 light chain [Listeria monocytogenes N53-1]
MNKKSSSNEGKPQHEQLITVKLPPEADYLNDETLEVYEKDKKKYDQTNQLITNNSVTILLGDFCYYEPAWSSKKTSMLIFLVPPPAILTPS